MRMTHAMARATSLTLILVMLVACAARPGQERVPTLALVLADNPWQRAIMKRIPEFELATGIDVQTQVFSEQQARDRIRLNLESQSPTMDVFMTIPSREGVEYASAGWYEPLDGQIQANPSLQYEDFSPGALASMRIGGATIALPINVESTALYYRKDVLQRLGLEVPRTISDLVRTAEVIHAEDQLTAFASRGLADALPFTFSSFFHSEGGEWSADGKTPSVTSPQSVEAIRIYSTLLRDFGPPGVLNNTFTQNSALMAQGKLAMYVDSTNELASLTGTDGLVEEALGVADFPAGPAGSRPTLVSWALAIPAHSSQKQAAWQFVEWAVSASVQQDLAVEGIASPRLSTSTSTEYLQSLDTPLKSEWSAVMTQAQVVGSVEVGPVGAKAVAMRRVIGNAVGEVIAGRMTPAEAANIMQASLEPLFG